MDGKKGCHVTWTNGMCTKMLEFLSDLVASGVKTSTGLKTCHQNACARAFNDQFKTVLNAGQIANHVRTWKMRYIHYNDLRKVSGAIWDEDNFIITLDEEHYNDYVNDNKDHKGDADLFNKPIEHYGKLFAIFGNSIATGQWAKGSNEALATDPVNIGEDENNDVAAETIGTSGVAAAAATNEDNGASSAAPKPAKRAKTSASVAAEEDGLVGAMKDASNTLTAAIIQAGKGNNELHDDLFASVYNILGFGGTQLAHYHAHLVENPSIARVFVTLPFDHKVICVQRYLDIHFPNRFQ